MKRLDQPARLIQPPFTKTILIFPPIMSLANRIPPEVKAYLPPHAPVRKDRTFLVGRTGHFQQKDTILKLRRNRKVFVLSFLRKAEVFPEGGQLISPGFSPEVIRLVPKRIITWDLSRRLFPNAARNVE